jgi:hypothetical protein
MKYETSWNAICVAASRLPEAFDGLDPVEYNFAVALVPLEAHPGHLEVTRPGGDTIFNLPDGRAPSLSDWIVPFPEEARDREGIAVPAEILSYL